MSVEYSAGVFYGTWVPIDAPLGARLNWCVDKHGGTPAPTHTDGIELDIVGSQSCGPEFVTVQAKGSTQSYGKGHLLTGPTLLSDAVQESRWKDLLTVFFAREDIGPASLPPVGWYFAGSVS